MTIKEFQAAIQAVLRILKKRFPNLTTEEAFSLASDIVNSIIDTLGLEQK